MKVTQCPDADELAEVVRGLFSGGNTAGGITRPLTNGERYYIVPESSARSDHNKMRTAQAEAASLRAEVERFHELLTNLCAEDYAGVGNEAFLAAMDFLSEYNRDALTERSQ